MSLVKFYKFWQVWRSINIFSQCSNPPNTTFTSQSTIYVHIPLVMTALVTLWAKGGGRWQGQQEDIYEADGRALFITLFALFCFLYRKQNYLDILFIILMASPLKQNIFNWDNSFLFLNGAMTSKNNKKE